MLLIPGRLVWSICTYLQHILTLGNCKMTPMPYDTKPLPEIILAEHQWGLMAFTWGQFHSKFSRYLFVIWIKVSLIRCWGRISQGQWVHNRLATNSTTTRQSPKQVHIYCDRLYVIDVFDDKIIWITFQSIILHNNWCQASYIKDQDPRENIYWKFLYYSNKWWNQF